MDDLFDESNISEFVAESRDHLEAIEPDLLELERDGAQVPKDLINRVFRAMHSIKGASSFFGLDALTNLSHVMENVLMKFRDGELIPSPDNIDALLVGADKVRLMLDDVHSSNEIPYSDELKKLNIILGNERKNIISGKQGEVKGIKNKEKRNEKKSEESKSNKDIVIEKNGEDLFDVKISGPYKFDDALFQIDEESLKSLSVSYLNLFAVWVDKHIDLNEKGRSCEEFINYSTDFGVCICSDLDKTISDSAGKNTESFFHLLFETVIDADIFSAALEITEEQVKLIDKKLLDPLKAKEKKITAVKKSIEKPDSKALQKPSQESKTIASAETIRVSVELIDRLMNLAGELVLGRNQLRQELESAVSKNPKLGTLMQNVDVVTSEVQEEIMQMRMQPVGSLLNKLPRIVRDLSRQLSKEAEIIIEGNEVELDKSILEGLSDPLTHLIRNCMDHGIEIPEERENKGKDRIGTIYLKTFHEGGQVNILVKDDGKGIDLVRLVEKAVSSQLISQDKASHMNEMEKINLIFFPGLSTAKKVTDVSGRGVGMDVVKTNIEKLGGHLEIETALGKGTTVRIRLPLTLAIIPSLIVGTGQYRFTIPQVNVKELVWIKASDTSKKIEKVGGAEVLRLRGRLLPIVRLADVLGMERNVTHPKTGELIKDRRNSLADRRFTLSEKKAESIEEKRKKQLSDKKEKDRRRSYLSDINVVVLRMGNNTFGLTVDELFDNEEIVVKPLSNHIKDCKCFSGATIMGDGKVAMILDAAGIAEFAKLRFSEINAEERKRKEEEASKSRELSGLRQSVLVFNNAYEEYFALPLESISRLELIKHDQIHFVGNRQFIDYRGDGLPLIYLETLLPVRAFPKETKEIYIIIPKTVSYPTGIVVSKILDTVEIQVAIHKDNITPGGFLGTAFVEGHLTHFLDTKVLIELFEKEAKDCRMERGGKIH